MKKILLVIGAVILCVVLGLMVPKFMNDGTGGMEVDVDALQQRFEQELIALLDKQGQEAALIEKYEDAYDAMLLEQRAEAMADSDVDLTENDDATTTNDLLVDDENTEGLSGVTDSPSLLEVDSNDAGSTVDENIIEDQEPSEIVPVSTTEVEIVLTKEEQVVKDQWVQEQISANRDQIADEDLYSGAAIYNLLDTKYLFGLAEDGLTAEERIEVEAYLRSVLTDEQLALALELYSKYVHLIN